MSLSHETSNNCISRVYKLENVEAEVLAGTPLMDSTISPLGRHDAHLPFVALCTNTDQTKPSHLIQRSEALVVF